MRRKNETFGLNKTSFHTATERKRQMLPTEKQQKSKRVFPLRLRCATRCDRYRNADMFLYLSQRAAQP